MEKTSIFQDLTFRRIVVASTGLGLACMFGSLAAIRIGQGSGLEFRWHWSIGVVIAAAFLGNWRLWSAVWKTQDNPDEKSKRKLRLYLGVLLVLGIGSFLYPIRFIEQSYQSGILKGLLTAGTFLGTMFWLIYKCGKGLSEIDSVELKEQGQECP